MNEAKAPVTEDYSASSLTVLEGLDAVRKRPGMYIGSTDSRGLQHCMWEIIDNSVDEAIAGHCKHIEVLLHDDGSIEVRDDGRGIPTDIEPKTGLSGVQVVMTKLHAGGKFGGGSYTASGGLHGVGASVVNALSSRLDVEVDRAGKTHALSFQRGESGEFDDAGTFKAGAALRVVGSCDPARSGTRVRYWADRTIFLAEATIDLELTYQRARQTAFLVPGLEIVVRDQRAGAGTVEQFKFNGGVSDFVRYIAKDKPVSDVHLITGTGAYVESVPVLEDGAMVTREVQREMGVEIALQWGNGYEGDIRSFVNIISTPKGGTHVAGFERSLTKSVNDALKSHKVLRTADEPVLKEDVLEGLYAVVTVRMSEPQFEGQTKEILGTAAANKIVSDVVSSYLRELFSNNKQKAAVRPVLEKIANAAKTRKALREKKETIRRKNALESSSMPSKLADCRSEDLEQAEIFIVEGDSAMGTAKAARNSEFQALLPIRGKILNTYKASEADMLKNAECAAIITAIGGGSGRDFDLDSIRYGKLIVMTDADVDGAHIRCLLLTLAYRYMRPLLEAGRVYAAMPPLHKIPVKGSKEAHYTYTQEEMERTVARLERSGKRVGDIMRYKGLGEMSADELAETTIDPDRRKLRQITMEDAQEALTVFELLMGNDVAPRRDFIVENGGLLDPERIDA